MVEIVIDGFGVCFYGNCFQVYMVECVQIGDEYLVIGMVCCFLIEIEGISIFYQEFVVLYDVELWMDFVMEFLLDMIKVQWQVFVGLYIVVEDIGDYFFIGWIIQYVVFVVVGDVQYFFVIGIIVFVFVLQVCWLDGWY